MLEARHITVRRREKIVVDDVSFTCAPGEWLMIAGPNGAGKTTLLRAVSRGETYEGEVFLDGEDLRKKKPRDLARHMGVLMQQNSASYDFTVEEVVAMGRYAYEGPFGGESEADIAAIERALRMTGMNELRHRPVTALSGGERQRMFLAQVFAQETEYLLLDEPTNHLDLIYQKQIFELIANWRGTAGRAVVSVTHDLSLAKAYGDKVLLMKAGKDRGQGTPAEVLTRERLEDVYEMDVYAWMRAMYGQW